MPEVDEDKVAEYLAVRALVVTRFSKEERRKGKTPDFRVAACGQFAFYCEVKSVVRDSWLDRLLEKVSPGQIAGGLRNDPIFNRLTDDIHTAVQQFDAVNPDYAVPNVLAFVNHDKNCGFLDLIDVLTGNFLVNDGTVHSIYRQFSEGRIKDEKARIHLYIWLDDFRPERQLYSRTHAEHHAALCQYFGTKDGEIKNIDS